MITKSYFRRVFLLCFFLIPAFAFSQNWQFDENSVAKRLKTDIYVLASDSFEGRETGTKAELKAAAYIADRFREAGLLPFFPSDAYISAYKQPAFRNYLLNISEFSVGENVYKKTVDFYPLYFSGSEKVRAEMVAVGYGIIATHLNYNDYEGKKDLAGKIFVIETGLPADYSEKSPFHPYISLKSRVALAVKMGAKAVVFVNSDRHYLNPSRKISQADSCCPVPVIFFSGKPAELFKKALRPSAFVSVEMQAMQNISGKLVAGYINNKASQTIVIGAHFDHLGFTNKNGKKVIFYGADDNASGTAAIIELARYVKSKGLKNKNYIFIAFSGEEKGLIGSTYFASATNIKRNQVIVMLNFDMIGRLSRDNAKLTLEGTGSSPSWDTLLKHCQHSYFKLHKVAATTGTSDQHPFYKKKVPVLAFFTGLHSDYHKPTDQAKYVNFTGAARVVAFSEEIITKLDLCRPISYKKIPGIRIALATLSIVFQSM